MGSYAPEEVPIKPAATVMVMRDGPAAAEVLMVRRHRAAIFMAGARVFPGGAVDEIDSSEAAHRAVRWTGDREEFGWRAAAVRELAEEAGIALGADSRLIGGKSGESLYEAVAAAGAMLDADSLTYVSNWVTPMGPPRRFDARFFVTAASGDANADEREVFDARWIEPREALLKAAEGSWILEPPTRWHLEKFAGCRSAADAVALAGAMPIERIAPRIAGDSQRGFIVLLPGDPGFEDAPA